MNDLMKKMFFYAPDGGDGASDGAQDQSGTNVAQKFIDKRDPVTGQTIKIPAELDSVLGHFIQTTRTETEKKYKPLVEKLESEQANFDTVKAELEKMKEASMTAEERAQANAKKVIDEQVKKAQLAIDEAKTWRERFEKTMIKNDIFAAFGGVELCNSKQTAMLLEAEGNAKISEKIDQDGKPTGEFETRLTLELTDSKGGPLSVDGTPEELFKKWIALDRNAHHRKNIVPSGGGSRTTTKIGGLTDVEKSLGLKPTARMDAARGIRENIR